MGSSVVYIQTGQEINGEVLKDLIDSHLRDEVPRLTELYNYYKGKHKILIGNYQTLQNQITN